MERPDPVPHAVSFRQLERWRHQAAQMPKPGDTPATEAPATASPQHGPELEPLLSQYEQLSQALLRELSRQANHLRQQRSGEQLMALGALGAHLRLSLQALAASRR